MPSRPDLTVLAHPIPGTRSVQGESPRWDARDGSVFWVDMRRRCFTLARVTDDGLEVTRTIDVGREIGAVAPLEQPGEGWVVAAGDGFLHVAESGEVRELATGIGPEGTFFNDGVADPHGRFWAGTQSVPREPTSALHSLERDGSVLLRLAPVTVSNGIAFTPDGAVMYYVDTLPHRRLEAFDVKPDGTLTGRRTIVEVTDGNPDGITVDDQGGVWVAVWGTGEARRYTPDGELDFVVRADAPLTSAVALVDDLLLITTACGGGSLPQHPLEGLIFRARVPFRGAPTPPWRPAGELTRD